MRVILVFVDGLGIGPATDANPLAAHPNSTPYLSALIGGRLTTDTIPVLERRDERGRAVVFKGLDAAMGVAGLPQSATGQTTIYTGLNAPAHLGRHMTGFPGGSLRPLIEEHGILKRVVDMGKRATLANAYSPAYFEGVEKRRIRLSVSSRLSAAAGLAYRMLPELLAGDAISWDITNRRFGDMPLVEPQEAGRRLARMGAVHNLTIFETFLTDFAGHKQDKEIAETVLRMVDDFFAGILAALPDDTTLVATSDHGNIEDLSRKTHTYNSSILLAVGPAAPLFASPAITDLTHITPTILAALEEGDSLVDRG